MRTLSLLLLFVLASCESARSIRHSVVGATPYERYADQLRNAGLHETAVGEGWLTAGERALATPALALAPFRETGYFAAAEPAAAAWRFSLRRGQQLQVAVEVASEEPARVFLDLYEVPADTADEPRHVAHADDGSFELDYEPRRDTELILRLQPELLRTVRFTLDARVDGSLAFPVHGRDTRAVGSRFGAPRDAGAREHHGVDIFAPLGTPVLAASDGVVRRAGTNRLGGNVVWLTDSRRGISQYYAHLDTHFVVSGQRVRAGDTLGLVGNTGNARTTPPHLHFGVYASRQGPVDPWPYIYRTAQALPRVTADTGRLGEWSRSRQAQTTLLRASPNERGDVVARLARHTPLRVLGASGGWFRVQLPDGAFGYVSAAQTESIRAPVATRRLAAAAALRDRPALDAILVDSIPGGNSIRVLGRYAGFSMIEYGEGRRGWVEE